MTVCGTLFRLVRKADRLSAKACEAERRSAHRAANSRQNPGKIPYQIPMKSSQSSLSRRKFL